MFIRDALFENDFNHGMCMQCKQFKSQFFSCPVHKASVFSQLQRLWEEYCEWYTGMCKKEDIHVLPQHLPGMMTKATKTAVTPASPWAKNWKRYLVNTTIMHNAYLGVGISRTIVSGSTGPSYFPFFCFFCSFFNLMFRNCSYGQYQYVKMATVRIIIQFYK